MIMNRILKIITYIIIAMTGMLLAFLFFFQRDISETDLRAESFLNIDDLSDCQPYNYRFDHISEVSYSVEWQTKEECYGYVKFGDSRASLTRTASEDGGIKKRKNHKVILENLRQRQTYYLTVLSGEIEYGNDGIPWSFQTGTKY
ncbi:MAG TPA: hypothetical protein ENN64_00325 [bacterium]|nr:hypothetical protein [bacterium]